MRDVELYPLCWASTRRGASGLWNWTSRGNGSTCGLPRRGCPLAVFRVRDPLIA